MTLQKAVTFLGRSLGIGFIEFLVIGRFAPFREVVRATKAVQLGKLAPQFDPAVYLRQIRSPWRRKRAARDPLLHYLLIGWREARSPNARFDPIFFGNDMRAGAVYGEPLSYLLSIQDSVRAPQNEIEAAAVGMSDVGPQGSTALIFHHSRGGGSSKFLTIFEDDLRRQGVRPLRLRLLPKSDRLVVWPGEPGDVFDIVDDLDALIAKARGASIDRIVISHLIDFNSTVIFERLDALIASLDARLWVILHDYLCLCPRVNLVDSRGRPCTIPSTDGCASCVAEAGSEIGRADPAKWRARFFQFLDKAERIFVPSEDMRERVSRFAPKPLEVWRPQQDVGYPPSAKPRLGGKDKLAVVVLGSLNEAKGSRVVLDLARRVQALRAPVAIKVYGETDLTKKLQAADVEVTGRYRDSEIGSHLTNAPAHIVLMPAIWPETWSFVLTSALERGLPVMAFAHGAQFERLRDLGREEMLMPVDWFDKPELILDNLLKYREACLAHA